MLFRKLHRSALPTAIVASASLLGSVASAPVPSADPSWESVVSIGPAPADAVDGDPVRHLLARFASDPPAGHPYILPQPATPLTPSEQRLPQEGLRPERRSHAEQGVRRRRPPPPSGTGRAWSPALADAEPLRARAVLQNRVEDRLA